MDNEYKIALAKHNASYEIFKIAKKLYLDNKISYDNFIDAKRMYKNSADNFEFTYTKIMNNLRTGR